MSATQILKRQGYRKLEGACVEPASIWQGPNGRRVMLEDGRIYTKQDIERRIVEMCGPDTAGYYRAVIHNWE